MLWNGVRLFGSFWVGREVGVGWIILPPQHYKEALTIFDDVPFFRPIKTTTGIGAPRLDEHAIPGTADNTTSERRHSVRQNYASKLR